MFHFYYPKTQTTEYAIRNDWDLQDFKSAIDSDDMGKTCRIKVQFERYDKELLSKVEGVARQVAEKGVGVELLIDSSELNFSVGEMEQIIDLEDRCVQDDIGVYCDDGMYQYTLTDTLSAQVQLEGLIDKIKNSGGSPLEQYLMAYNYVSSKVYKENNQNRASARDLTAILNGEDIVCVGYARLMERICEGLGIKSYCQNVDVFNKEGKFAGKHQNNLVYLKDEKYGIDGYYYSDACWDAVEKQGQYKRRLSHCLIPLKDKDKMRMAQIDVGDKEELSDKKVKLKYLYGEEVDKFSIELVPETREEQNEIYYKTNTLLINDKKRQSACKKLITMLKKLDISADCYKADEDHLCVPAILDYNYILALLMNPKENASEIDKVIQGFQDIKNSRVEKFEGMAIKTVDSVDDVYAYLENMSKLKSRRVEDYSGYKTEVHSVPREWKDVCRETEKLESRKLAAQKTGKEVKQGEPIPVERFKEALEQCFIAEGMLKSEAIHNAELMIETTIQDAEKRFDETAENDFRQTALKRRALENGRS